YLGIPSLAGIMARTHREGQGLRRLRIVRMVLCIIEDSLPDENGRVGHLLQALNLGCAPCCLVGHEECRWRGQGGCCLLRRVGAAPRLAPPIVAKAVEGAEAGDTRNPRLEIRADSRIAQDSE